MVSALEVPAEELIKQVGVKLKTEGSIKPPAWAGDVKTGVQAMRKPADADWWYIRCASILRKLYMDPQGVGSLRSWYGAAQSRGVKPEHHKPASGNIIRKALQQLETAGYVKKEAVGRTITPKGRSLLDKTTLEIKKGVKIAKPAKPEPTESGARGAVQAAAAGAKKEGAAKKPAGAKGKGKAVKSEAGQP